MGTIAAAAIIAKERDIVDRFRDVGVTSIADARRLDDVGIGDGVALRRLRRHEVIREASPEMFYLDEPVWNAVRSMRRRMLGALFLIVMIITIGVLIGVLSLK